MARPAECQTRASSERSVATSHCSFFCCIAMLGLGGCSLLGGLGRSPSRSCRSASCSPGQLGREDRPLAVRHRRRRLELVGLWSGPDRRVTWLQRAAARAARSARPPAGDVPRPFPRLLTPFIPRRDSPAPARTGTRQRRLVAPAGLSPPRGHLLGRRGRAVVKWLRPWAPLLFAYFQKRSSDRKEVT